MSLRSKIALCFILWGIYGNLSAAESLQERLRQDIEDERLDHFTLIEAAFILSGVDHQDSLSHCLRWYHDLLQTIKDYHFDPFDRSGSAAKVFSALHSTWLITYKEQATTLLDIIRSKQFNCVAATILYNLLCQDLGWSTEAFETPTHTYTIFSDFADRLMVENTTPMGFNIMKNLREYSRYLLQFYPDHRAAQIGLDRLYAYENSKGRLISNLELLGLLAYNRAYLAEKKKDYEQAYRFVLLAQKFNRDSRSNINFEINLYYRWGLDLFEGRRFYEAFTVLADGTYRYPQEPSLARNCQAAFINTLSQLQRDGDWSKSVDLLQEFQQLQLPLEEKVQGAVRELMQFWLQRFMQNQQRAELVTAIDLMAELGITDESLVALRRQAAGR